MAKYPPKLLCFTFDDSGVFYWLWYYLQVLSGQCFTMLNRGPKVMSILENVSR